MYIFMYNTYECIYMYILFYIQTDHNCMLGLFTILISQWNGKQIDIPRWNEIEMSHINSLVLVRYIAFYVAGQWGT